MMSQFTRSTTQGEIIGALSLMQIHAYPTILYSRWLCYCHVPAFCDSLPRYETTIIFGRTLLRSVFQTMRKQLLDKFRAEKDKMPSEKRTLVLTHFPKWVSLSLSCPVSGHLTVLTFSSTASCPCWRRKSMAATLPSGTLTSHNSPMLITPYHHLQLLKIPLIKVSRSSSGIEGHR